MDYTFEIGKRFGNIPFVISDTDIKKLLGKPDDFSKDIGVDCYTSDYKYLKYGLDISYMHFKNFEDELQIQTEKIILKENNLYSLTKNKIIELIKEEYKKRKIEYKFEYELFEFCDAENQEEYDFEQIGLTLWFKNSKLYNASVSKPMA